MTPELTVLALAALLQMGQYVLMSVPANIELGTRATLGPRDPAPGQPPLADRVSPRTGRLIRALDNHFQALVLFTIAVVVVTLSGAASGFTAAMAWLYLAARLAYVPAYALGLSPWRSLIWLVGLVATFLMLLAALV